METQTAPTESLDWSALVDRELRIPAEFIHRHEATIFERLLAAADELSKGREATMRGGDPTAGTFVDADFRGITQSLHVARSTLLLGAKSDNLKRTLERIPRVHDLAGHDPANIATVAVLYSLIQRFLAARGADDPRLEKLKAIHRRFDELNWMTSRAAMTALRIAPLD